MEKKNGTRLAGEVLEVTVARRWSMRYRWQVQIRRRADGRVVQRFPHATRPDAQAMADRAGQALASDPLEAFCHVYLITHAAVR